MKRAIFLAVALLVVISAMPASAGNGLPADLKGAHYNLNIIGVQNAKTADMTGDNGHRIFVPLNGSTKIMLAEGPDFQVLDANGTDNTSAKFQLPAPATCDPNATSCDITYQVWARYLGKPGGKADLTTCGDMPVYDPITGVLTGYETVCSVGEFVLHMDNTGRPQKFVDVSQYLLFVSNDIDGDGKYEHVPLFYDGWQDFYWQYDNFGLKLAQLRFFEVGTTINW